MKLSFIIVSYRKEQCEKTLKSLYNLGQKNDEIYVLALSAEDVAISAKEAHSACGRKVKVVHCLPEKEVGELKHVLSLAEGDCVCLLMEGCVCGKNMISGLEHWSEKRSGWNRVTVVSNGSLLPDENGCFYLYYDAKNIANNADGDYVQSYDGIRYLLQGNLYWLRNSFADAHDIPRWLGNNILDWLRRWERFDEGIEAASEEGKRYRSLANELLQYIDDQYFLQVFQMHLCEKAFWLEKKYGESVAIQKEKNDIFYSIQGTELPSDAYGSCVIRFIRFSEGHLEIEGSISRIHGEPEMKIFLRCGEKKYFCERVPYQSMKQWQGEQIFYEIAFHGELPYEALEENNEIWIECQDKDFSVIRRKLGFGKFAPLEESLLDGYYSEKGWIVSYDSEQGCLFIEKKTAQLLKHHRRAFFSELLKTDDIAAKKSLFFRLLAPVAKKIWGRKPIWLVSDRVNRGNDNGEAFFEYLSANKDLTKSRHIYFVIDKNCPDAKRIRQYGRLIKPMSWRHKILHLLSEYVISSQANDPVVNPFRGSQKYYRDMLQKEKFVFLQHGVIKDNLSGWLNRYNRKMYGFVVSTIPEYKSIFQFNYAYDKENVWLTGLPRFDKLCHDEKKYITVMPTWRKSLTAGTDPDTSQWLLRDNFEESSYFKFYDALLNHEGLITFAGDHGYTICFMPHPIMLPYVRDHFHQHEKVIFWDERKPYREIFSETNLLVTDYSSVVYDFVYLRKPVLYCHFDYETFYNGSHSYTEGYFDYQRDGYGEIVFDLDATVEKIKRYIQNGCQVADKYLERINNTFAFDDKKNCERVLEHMLSS